MIDLLDLKIKQMHEALENVELDLSSIRSKRVNTPEGYYAELDFSQGKTEAGLANIATLLVSNIACLKDHLKIWCAKNNKRFEGDDLINGNKNVALVHDLWTTEKHAELSNPRSGHRPRLQNVRGSLILSSGTGAGSGVLSTWDPRTGEMKTATQGDGSVRGQISGQIIDEGGATIGDFVEVCEKAATAWEQALLRAGVKIPTR